MNLHFLGGYLLADGLVTPEQLARAMAHQANSNRRLGELALEMGLLTPEQVEDIIRLQGSTDLSFGELAMAKGYLSRKSLIDLLFHQNVCQVHLGEALLLTGALTPEQFHSALKRFGQTDADHRASISLLLADYEEQHVLTILLRALERAFMRFVALPLKVCTLLAAEEIDALPHAFGMAIEIPGRERIRIVLKMDDRMLRLMAQGLTGADLPTAAPASTGLEAAGVFFQVVSHYCRQSLDTLVESGRCYTIGREILPPCDSPSCLRLSLVCPDATMSLAASCCPRPPSCTEHTP